MFVLEEIKIYVLSKQIKRFINKLQFQVILRQPFDNIDLIAFLSSSVSLVPQTLRLLLASRKRGTF